ncbi:MAG: hypothetical protein GX488_05825 [Clostridiales bacterium]|nr:hypothetical protein [Clostridiales bacterium]
MSRRGGFGLAAWKAKTSRLPKIAVNIVGGEHWKIQYLLQALAAKNRRFIENFNNMVINKFSCL